MTPDPRALLDAYASKPLPDFMDVVGFDDSAETFASEAIKALRDVLDIHHRSVLRAGVVPEQFGAGKCAYCHRDEPIRRFEGDINGRWMDAHEHVDPEPYCSVCEDGSGEFSEAWPCPTVRAITSALEAS